MEEVKSSNAKWFILILAALAVAGLGFYYYQYGKIKSQSSTRNWYSEVRNGKWGKDIESAVTLAPDNPAQAIEILERVKSDVTDPGQKSIVDLTIASVDFFNIDKLNGAESYAAVAANNDYPSISRAYAMMAVADQFDGLQDKNLLEPFFTEQEFASKSASVLIADLYQRIYDTHPFGLAAGKLGSWYVVRVRKNNAISDQEYAKALEYATAIEKSIPELESTAPLQRFIPVTLLVRAHLFRLLAEVNRLTADAVSNAYLFAIARSRTLNIPSTEQFSVLLYADFLAKEKENKGEVIRLLSKSLPSSGLHPMVKNVLVSAERLESWFPNLYTLVQEDSQVKAAFLKLAG